MRFVFDTSYNFCWHLFVHDKVFSIDDKVKFCIEFDILYMFSSFAIQLSNRMSNYVIEWSSVLALDIFFKGNVGDCGMSTAETLNHLGKQSLRSFSSENKNFGVRKISLSSLTSNTSSMIDKHANTALQMLFFLSSQTGNIFSNDSTSEEDEIVFCSTC